MSQPPNRIGGIRGPNGATLDDILATLTLIRNGQLLQLQNEQAIRTALDTLVTRVTYLTGTSAPNATNFGASLPAYLQRVLGWTNPQGPQAGSIQQYAIESFDALNSLRQAAAGVDVFAEGDNIYTRIFNALSSLEGDNVYARLGSIRDNSLALLQAVGSLPSTPASETVKTLLAALVACCEDGNDGSTPQPGLNPPPPNACLESDGYTPLARVLGWSLVGEADGDTNIYQALWPTNTPAGYYLIPAAAPFPQGQGIASDQGDFARACFAWDFTGAIPGLVTLPVESDGVWRSSASGTSVVPSFPIGGVPSTVGASSRLRYS